MVDTKNSHRQGAEPPAPVEHGPISSPSMVGICGQDLWRAVIHRNIRAVLVAIGVIVIALCLASVAQFSPTVASGPARSRARSVGVSPALHQATTRTAKVAVKATTAPVRIDDVASQIPASPTAAPAPLATVASMIEQVETAGIDPGPTWSWSMGTSSAQCGTIGGVGTATGCTSWTSGTIRTVFVGSPSLALVAHEVANAETEADALPALLTQVATAAAGSSWSPTDAAASCLVFHILGFQDNAAGTWQCPASLADYVAAHIHDTLVTTTTTAVCGRASNISSTLTFVASAGTLAVTGPGNAPPPQTAPAGTPLTVSGIGTFTAVDVGGTAVTSGTCEG